jgi:hypothetical protein
VQLCQAAPRKSLLSSESGGERHSTWLCMCFWQCRERAFTYVWRHCFIIIPTPCMLFEFIITHTHARSHILGSGEQAAFIIIYRRNNFTLATNSIRTNTHVAACNVLPQLQKLFSWCPSLEKLVRVGDTIVVGCCNESLLQSIRCQHYWTHRKVKQK